MLLSLLFPCFLSSRLVHDFFRAKVGCTSKTKTSFKCSLHRCTECFPKKHSYDLTHCFAMQSYAHFYIQNDPSCRASCSSRVASHLMDIRPSKLPIRWILGLTTRPSPRASDPLAEGNLKEIGPSILEPLSGLLSWAKHVSKCFYIWTFREWARSSYSLKTKPTSRPTGKYMEHKYTFMNTYTMKNPPP